MWCPRVLASCPVMSSSGRSLGILEVLISLNEFSRNSMPDLMQQVLARASGVMCGGRFVAIWKMYAFNAGKCMAMVFAMLLRFLLRVSNGIALRIVYPCLRIVVPNS